MSFEGKKVVVNDQTFLALVNKGLSEGDVIKQAQEIEKLQPEMMEWRIDYFKDIVLMNRLLEVADKIKTIMDKAPILTTFRSKKFGEEIELDNENAYLNLVKIAVDFKLENVIDIGRDHASDRIAGLI